MVSTYVLREREVSGSEKNGVGAQSSRGRYGYSSSECSGSSSLTQERHDEEYLRKGEHGDRRDSRK